MITIQIIDHETGKSAIAEFPNSQAESFRSTLLNHSNELGERASGSHNYDKEDALTRAMGSFGQFRAAVNRVIEREDPHYE